MRISLKHALLGLVGLVAAMMMGAVWVVLEYAGAADAQLRGPVMLYVFAALILFAAITGGVYYLLRRSYLRPQAALARDIRMLLETKQLDRGLRVPDGHMLGDLPAAVEELIDSLGRVRRETKRAMATATAQVEEQKGWLEIILLELIREGVIVCGADHRILLYNYPASRLFHASSALGLGRPLFGLLAEEPVQHALERLEYRLESGSRDLKTRFVCASADASLMLQANIALIADQEGETSGGYVITLEDISTQIDQLQKSELVRRAVTQDLRGPLASLRAAAEMLMSFDDLEESERRTFQDLVMKDSTLLSERLEAVAAAYEEGAVAQQWPMTEIYSRDLFQCVLQRLDESLNIDCSIAGEHQWLKADSHSLMLVLAHLLRNLSDRAEGGRFEIEAGFEEEIGFIDMRWVGRPASDSSLNQWLSEVVPGLPGVSAAQVLEQHGGEPWSRKHDDGRAILRIPLRTSVASSQQTDEEHPPPRPEFYDFELMQNQAVSKEFAARKLKDLRYVVFDTEATGLRPTEGDQLIEISAVRVVNGRVITGETFDSLINPGCPIPKDSIRFHHITDDMVADQPGIEEVLPRFHEFVGDDVLVAHNAAFDVKFIKLYEPRCKVTFDNPVMDTLLLSALLEGAEEDHSLDAICERLRIDIKDRHRALGDAIATAHVLVMLLERLFAQDMTFGELMRTSNMEASLRVRAIHF